LASSKVQSPDPRAENPFLGQRLIIAWDLPHSLFDEDLEWVATVRFWNHVQEVRQGPIARRRDCTALFFPEDGTLDTEILTYRVQVMSGNREVEVWEHHFWTDWNPTSASNMSSSVSVHPKQESVMETP